MAGGSGRNGGVSAAGEAGCPVIHSCAHTVVRTHLLLTVHWQLPA